MGSEELNALVDEALSGNFDHPFGMGPPETGRCCGPTGRRGPSKPTVDYNTGADKSWTRAKTKGAKASRSSDRAFLAGAGASYELDLWGRLDALRQSEASELEATREDLETAAVTVAAEIVAAYTDILSVRQQITILEDQIQVNRNLLKLQETRFVNGKADALDVSQQREALAAARAKLPELKLSERQYGNALAVLLGRTGAHDLIIDQTALPALPDLPSVGIPADLLSRRPDVRAAGLRLSAARWQVSAARADRLPSITLTADAAFSSSALDLLFDNWISTLAAGITGPIFDGGGRAAEVDRTRAAAEESLADYAKTVAVAIQEVEDGLAVEKCQNEHILLLKEQLDSSRTALKDAMIQYLNGQDNYLDYLTALTSVQDLERQLVEERAELIKNRVVLYRAAGGDWTRELISA